MPKYAKIILFMLFLAIGSAAVTSSILCDDLVTYYRNRTILKKARNNLERLVQLNADYDCLLAQLKSDPNIVKRIAPVTLGITPADNNAVYPKTRARQLAAARKALMAESNFQTNEPPFPAWIERLAQPSLRITLLLAGAGLILVSFICFDPTKT